MSVSRLLTPSSLTLRWTLWRRPRPPPGGGAPGSSASGPDGPFGLPGVFGAGRSRTEEYRGASGLRRTDVSVGGFQTNLERCIFSPPGHWAPPVPDRVRTDLRQLWLPRSLGDRTPAA